MNLLEIIRAKLAEPGIEPLTDAEKAALLEAIRRHGAWEVFVEYHHNAMWAREDATRKQKANTYLAPEAVEYMQGEIKRRIGREALLKAMEQEEQERVEREYAKGIAGTAAGQAAERGDKPDEGRDAADNRGAAGEGAQGTGGSGGVRQGESETQAVESHPPEWFTAAYTELARKLQTAGRGHESQSSTNAATQAPHSPAYEQADGVGGEDQGTQGEGI